MKRSRLKRLSDFTPFILLMIYTLMLVWTISITAYVLTWRNMVGIAIIPINVLFFVRQYQAEVLFLGLVLTLGLFGVLSYTPGLTSTTITLRFNDSNMEFWGQPIFLLLIV